MITIARVLLMAYAVVLTIRGVASLQGAFLLLSFVLLLWNRRMNLHESLREAWWVWGPLLIFSTWVFAVCLFWPNPPPNTWDPGAHPIHQPVFSLTLWKRDILVPMVALLSGYWAFREEKWKGRLFTVQSFLVVVLAIQCLWQYKHGEFINGKSCQGTLQVRGFSHDNIFFAYILFLLTPCALWWSLSTFPLRGKKISWMEIWRVLVPLLILYLIFINKRRGTWMAVYVEAILLVAWLGKRRLAAFLLVTSLMGLAAWHFRPQWFVREYDLQRQYQVEQRTKISRDAVSLLGEHPWVGVGFGKDAVTKNYWMFIYQQAHDSFINMALEVGWPGLLIWMGGLGVYGIRFWKDARKGWLHRIGLVFLIGFCIRNLTDDVWISSVAELFWFQIGVLLPSQKGGDL